MARSSLPRLWKQGVQREGADYSLASGQACFWDDISSIPDYAFVPQWLGRHCLVCGNRVYDEKVLITVGRKDYIALLVTA